MCKNCTQVISGGRGAEGEWGELMRGLIHYEQLVQHWPLRLDNI